MPADKQMNVRHISKHVLSIFMLGIIVVIIEQLSQYVTVLWLIARRSNRFPLGSHVLEAIEPMNDFIYDSIGIPVMWIRPQSMFDNEIWMVVIIGIFWGLTLYTIRLCYGYCSRVLAKRIRRFLRERSEK
jgi:hypothetical protein